MPKLTAVQITENMNNLPFEELAKYENKWVAWTPDGTRIIAGADNLDELERAVTACGMKLCDTVLELIPPLDQAFLGGAA
jgi:hypothetical protein